MRAFLLLRHNCSLYVFLIFTEIHELIGLVVNFIQRPLPEGSTTGAGYDHSNPGALGMGQQASTGLTLCEFPGQVILEEGR